MLTNQLPEARLKGSYSATHYVVGGGNCSA